MEQYSKKHSAEAWRERLREELAETSCEVELQFWRGRQALQERLQRELLDVPQVAASEAGKQAEDLAQWTVAACLAAVFALVALMAQAGGPL